MNAYRKIAGVLAIGALSCIALSPAFAQGHSSGGHSSSGGGGHAHYASGGGHSGYSGSHYGSYGGSYGRGSYYGRGGSSYYGHAGSSYYGHAGSGYYARGGYYGHGGGYWGRGGYYGGWGHGFYGGFYGPRFGFGWFLPVLPAFYATYWFGGIPYYYANDAYYTWSPDYNGYVATEPPAGAVPENGSSDAVPPASSGGQSSGGQSYTYPKNGQTDEQQATDRYQCHQWAVSQSGYDPTRNGAAAAHGQGDYQRALSACLEGRGYSVR